LIAAEARGFNSWEDSARDPRAARISHKRRPVRIPTSSGGSGCGDADRLCRATPRGQVLPRAPFDLRCGQIPPAAYVARLSCGYIQDYRRQLKRTASFMSSWHSSLL
jgi:hypothetical protein